MSFSHETIVVDAETAADWLRNGDRSMSGLFRKNEPVDVVVSGLPTRPNSDFKELPLSREEIDLIDEPRKPTVPNTNRTLIERVRSVVVTTVFQARHFRGRSSLLFFFKSQKHFSSSTEEKQVRYYC